LAYEVTKQIKGRDYRYRVEGVRDPSTGRTRSHWQYLGRIDGDDVIAPARPQTARVTRDEIVAATARLLDSRDASRVTVSVIAQRAGVSPGTFYRHFGDRRSALGAAVAYLCDTLACELPSLDGPILTRAEEGERLSSWFETLHRAALAGRAFRWLLTSADAETYRAARDASSTANKLTRTLAAYLRRLDASDRAQIPDADSLAAALLRMHWSFVRDLVLTDVVDARSRWSEVFPVIERAVFPHHQSAAA
jgi:AcrR family transcriptional regulator